MSDEQLARIQNTLETLVSGQAAFKRDLEALRLHSASKEDLRGFATKEDLQAFPTRDDLQVFATKDDLQGFATKDDLRAFATKDDLQVFATKDDLQGFATKDDLQGFATKDDIQGFATKDDLQGFATKDDLQGFATKDDIQELRHHMGVLHEAVRADIRALGEPDSPTRREMRQGFDELKELFGRRLDPLELAVRHHTAELKKLG
jgi:uncharacterized protein (DUF2345 family)